MTQEQILEGNKLIAEFMDRKPYKSIAKDGEIIYIKYPEYNSSWDLLMPVVEKIESMRDEKFGWFQIFIHSNCCSIESKYAYRSYGKDRIYISDPTAVFQTKLESTWYNIVEFIKWYNNQNKK